MAVTEGLWDEPRFIRYAAERRLPLKFVTASFYDYRPGKFTRGMNVPRTIAHLRAAAVSAGLTNLFYGVDEGRILCGAKGADKGGAQLVLRIVGDTFQAAYDARIVKQIFDSGAKYFAWTPLFRRIPSCSSSSTPFADPWYTGKFDETYADIHEYCTALLKSL